MAVRASSAQERQQEVEGADRSRQGSWTFIVVEETLRIERTWTRKINPKEEERGRTRSNSPRRRSWTFVLLDFRPRTTTTSQRLLEFEPRFGSRSRSLLLPTPRFLPLPGSSTPAAAAAALLPTPTSSTASSTTTAGDLPSPDLPSELHLLRVRGTLVGRRRSRGSGRAA